VSELVKFARPYAKAAFQLARDGGRLAEWSDMLQLASSIAANKIVADAIGSPHVSRQQAASLFLTAAADQFDSQFGNLLSVLAENDRLSILPEIAGMYEKLRQDEEKRLSVRVVSAVALSDDQQQRMRAALSKRFDREISLESEIDTTMLGGAVIYAGDMVIDGSVRGRLQKLATRLAE
jgi:F-type H+-transporting ATPase subunit delta